MANEGPAPMQVDNDEGIELYNALVGEVLASQGLMVPNTKLMIAEKQLLIYHYAAKLHELRESVLSFWRSPGSETGEGLVEPFLSSLKTLKKSWQEQGKWNANAKVKKVFGHSGIIKFCPSMPNFPGSAAGCFVFLQQRPVAATVAAGRLWSFTEGCGNDPLADLEAKGLALVLRMESYVKDAVVLVSPFLQHGSPQSEDLSKLIMKEPDVWRRLLKTDHELFSPASAALIKQVLRSGASTVTPRKPRPAVEDETPEKAEKDKMEKPKRAKNEKSEELGPAQGYAKLLEATLRELEFFTEPFQGLNWLENKKQLLVYHYAARMNEQKDAILQAISGSEEVKALDPVYQRAISSVRDELVQLLEGQKMKKIFSHDHVIRFHSLKGLPVHRESCVFLRERPQCSSDILRKTPSIFRDLIRYRGQTSPLMELEHHHLALVLTVTDRNPRAWLVISPLLGKPELLEKVSEYSWNEIKEKLQDELFSLIRSESDVWRGFIQRHADIVSKESLKIIQKVLKGCTPGTGVGEFTKRFAYDVEEAEQARELAQMRFAEAEQRWDMSAQVEVAKVEEQRLDAEKKVKHLTAAEKRLKIQVKLQASRMKAKSSKVLDSERQEAEERLENLQKDHRDEKSRLQKDLDETRSALGREELRALQLKEEATLLEDSKQELLQAIARLDSEERKDRRQWRTKNAVLKHQLKQSKLQHKELVAKLKTEAEAKLAETQAQLAEQAAQLGRDLEEAQKAQRSSFAQLEVQTAALQRTGQINTELRTAAAKAEDEAKSSREAAAAAAASTEEAKRQVEALQQELKDAEARHTEAREQMQKINAESAAVREEAGQLAETCRVLRLEAAKATLMEKEKVVLEEQFSKALMAQKKAVQRIHSLESAEKEMKEILKQREAELANKTDLLTRLQERNCTLQVAVADAAEKEQRAKADLQVVTDQLASESSAASAAQLALSEARQARETAQQETLLAQELCKLAEDKGNEAQAQQMEAEARAAEAEKAHLAVQQSELRAKAELISQSQEAQRLTEKCALLIQEKEDTEQKLRQKLVSQEQAEQALMAKQAELQVQQEALKTLQESNLLLREERARAYAASEEALKLSSEAQSCAEQARAQRLQAEAQAAECKKTAMKAEENLQEVSQQLAGLEAERQSWREQVEGLQRSVAVKALEVSKAQEDERKAAMKFTAQAQEASRLSGSLAELKGQLSSCRAEAEAALQRAQQAEAERLVALSASELSEEDVRRLAKEGPVQPAQPLQRDALVEDLEKLMEATSSPEKPKEAPRVEEDEQAEEAPYKKQRLEGAIPLRRIRFKSAGGGAGYPEADSR